MLEGLCGHPGSPFSAVLPGMRSFMRSLTCTHPCMLRCLPWPCDHCVYVAGCSAETPALSPGRLGCPAGNAEQRAVVRVFMFPSLGLHSSETRLSSGLSAGDLFAECSRGLGVQRGCCGRWWHCLPTHHLSALCRSHLGAPLGSVPLPSEYLCLTW